MTKNTDWQALTAHQPLPDTTTQTAASGMLAKLDQFGLLMLSGQDGSRFLQGQLTCDVSKLPASGQLCAHCNPQGRIISLFYLYERDANYFLLMPKSMLAVAAAGLEKYRIFFRTTTLSDVSEKFSYLGVHGLPTDRLPTLPFISLAAHSHIMIAEKNTAINYWSELAAILPIRNSNAWKAHTVMQGIPSIHPETTGRFLPHELNLETFNAIDFSKGCYTGQEIIARLHYRGKPKTAMYRGMLAASSALKSGIEIFCDDLHGKTVAGNLIDNAPINNEETRLLMVLSNMHLDRRLYIETDKKITVTLLPNENTA